MDALFSVLPHHPFSHSLVMFLTYSDPDKFQTTSNEAYNVVGGRAGSGRVGESEYETPQASADY